MMRYKLAFTVIGVGCIVDSVFKLGDSYRSIVERTGWFFETWLGFNLVIVGIAHWRKSHGMLGKQADGTLPLWSWFLFLPLQVYTIATWHLFRWLSRRPACQAVTDDLVVGRRLLAPEVADEFENFVDLTAEIREPLGVRGAASYRSFPILDGAAPKVEALRGAVTGLKPGRTYVHCALGHGRTGLFALAVLLERGVVESVEEGLQMLQAVRPGISLNEEQRKCAEEYAERIRKERASG